MQVKPGLRDLLGISSQQINGPTNSYIDLGGQYKEWYQNGCNVQRMYLQEN